MQPTAAQKHLLTPPAPPRPHLVRKPKKAPTPVGINGPATDYFKMPNAYALLIAGPEPKLSGAVQRDIIHTIILRTWGPAETVEWCRMSLTEFALACGGTDAGCVSRALADLVKRQIIAVDTPTGEPTEGAPPLRENQLKRRYKLTPHLWADAPPYEMPAVVKPAALAPEEDEANPETKGRRRRSFCDKVNIKPGKKVSSITAEILPKGKTELVPFRLTYANTGATPMQVSANGEADELIITFGPCLETIAEPEEKPGAIVSKQHQNRPVDSREQSEALETERFIAFRAVISDLLLSEFEKAFDPRSAADNEFVRQAAYVSGAVTADAYAARAVAVIREMRGKRKPVTSGILLKIAEQQGAAAAALAAKEASKPKPAAPQSRAEIRAEIRAYWAANPEIAEIAATKDPEYYAEVIAEGGSN